VKAMTQNLNDKKLETIHHYHICQKAKNNFFHTFARTEWGKKMVQRRSLNIWKKCLLNWKDALFQNSKIYKKIFSKLIVL